MRPRTLTALRRILPILLFALAPALARNQAAEVLTENSETEMTTITSPLGLASFGISGGWPGYQLASVHGSIQYQGFGLAVRLGPTAAGLALGASVRYYPPLALPVPLYLAVGGTLYGDSSAMSITAGGHIPISERFRIDVEAGAARVAPFGIDPHWLPAVSAGVSWIIPVELGGRPAPELGANFGDGVPGAACGPATSAGLESAMDRTVNSFIRSASATYAGSFTDLSYSYDITDVSVHGDSATVTITYQGSVREVLSGNRQSASGTASADFVWTGCGWRNTGLNY